MCCALVSSSTRPHPTRPMTFHYRITFLLFLAMAGCNVLSLDCEPRTVSTKGDLSIDIIGSWDWTTGGLKGNSDQWVWSFAPDGGLTIVHRPYAGQAPTTGSLTDHQAYKLIDGGFVQISGTTELPWGATVSGNDLVVTFLNDSTPVRRPAVSCRGEGF